MDLRVVYAWLLVNRQALTKTLVIMNLTAILLLATALQVSAAGFGQSVTLNTKDAPLQTVFQQIEKQTGYQFFYKEKAVLDKKPVTVQLNNVPLAQALNTILIDQELSFSIVEKVIVINQIAKSADPLIQVNNLPPPPVDVHGRVVNENGNPVEGVTVTVKGTKIATSTNSNGEFILKGIDEKAVLVFSSTNIEGFETKLNGKTELGLIAKTKISPLDDVQIEAYGTTTSRYRVGNISTVKSDQIDKQAVSNPIATLEGLVPGLVVSQSSGVPGASFSIQIRGQNSLNSNPDVNSGISPLDNPLFIVDGVPLAAQNTNLNQYSSIASPGQSPLYGNQYGGISPFNSINPSDIESIEILKDAAATSIYGSRGSNGVIIITTKKGKSGKTKINATIWTGASQITRTTQMMNTQQYLEMRHEAFKNDGAVPNISNAPDLLIYDTTKYTNWKKYFLGGTAHTTDANISVSGGSNNTTFLIGTAYHHETFIMPGDYGEKRASFNFNLHHTSINQRLLIDFQANYSYDQNNVAGSVDALTAFSLIPDYPDLTDASGNINWKYKGITLYNPLAYLKQTYSGKTYNLLSHFQIDYQILKGLTVRSSFGYNTINFNEYTSVPIAAQNPANFRRGRASFGTNDFGTWIVEPQIEYKKQISKGKLNLLLGGTFQHNNNASTNIYGTNYTNDALLGSISAAGTTSSSDAFSLYKYNAFFGRLNYVWKSKYIIELAGRRDGSSRFGPGKQFGNFGSIGGAWLFSEEKAIKMALPILSYGKLRVSYGTTGNDNIGNYRYLSNWAPLPGAPPYQGGVGYVPQNLFNPDFSWSVNKKLEAGLDFGVLKDRILLNISWYRNRCGNQLVSYPLPSQTGFGSVTQNFQAVVQNSGLEVGATFNTLNRKNFSWSSSFNITIPKNKLISFPGIESSVYQYYYVIGQSTTILQKLKYAGVNDTTGIFQFLTKNGEITYNPDLNGIGDQIPFGNLDQKYYGGFQSTFRYKSFELGISFNFAKQIAPNYLKQIYSEGAVVGSGSFNQPTAFLSRWQMPGDNSNIQRFSQSYGSLVYPAGSTYFNNSIEGYSDASYIRLKTLSLSYNLSSRYLEKVKIEKCKIYASTQNLFTISNYIGDPETHSYFGIPPLKTIVIGLQLTF